LFQHILDMLREVPAFSSDYSHILRELLPDVEYRLRMGKKIYNGIVTKFIRLLYSQEYLIPLCLLLACQFYRRLSMRFSNILQHLGASGSFLSSTIVF
jgi:fructose-1,6-bisphosphatase